MKLGQIHDPGLAWRLIVQVPDAIMLCKLLQTNSVFYTFILRNQLLIAAVEKDPRKCSQCSRKLSCCWCALLKRRSVKKDDEIWNCLAQKEIKLVRAYDAVERYSYENYWHYGQ